MNHSERNTRKQVLLTRIAFERIEIQREIAQARRATSRSNLLGMVMGGNLVSSLFGTGAAGGKGWLSVALSLLRRHRGTAVLLGGMLPMLRGRGGWRRAAMVACVGVASWLGWRALRGRNKPP